MLISVYMEEGSLCVKRIGNVCESKILRFHDGPFLIGNDWNMSAQDRGFGMARGNTRRSNRLFVRGNMRSGFRQVERQHVIGEASNPHVPITVRVQERPRAHKLHALRKIKELRLNKFLQKARRASHIFLVAPAREVYCLYELVVNEAEKKALRYLRYGRQGRRARRWAIATAQIRMAPP